MKIAVLGATGASGHQIVQQAVDRGHSVRAVVRSPEKLKISHDNLEVVKGDIFSTESLTEAFDGGCEAVLSGLGHHGFGPFTTCTTYSDSAKHIVEAMRNKNIKKFIAISSWCTESGRGNPKLLEWLVKPLFIGKLLADMGRMERYICEQCQDIVFISVRPPALSHGPVTDKEVVSAEQQYLSDVGWQMSRADVARFMLDCLQEDTDKSKCLAVGVK